MFNGVRLGVLGVGAGAVGLTFGMLYFFGVIILVGDFGIALVSLALKKTQINQIHLNDSGINITKGNYLVAAG